MALPMLSKETARYRDNGGREHCSLCRHFIPDRGGSCRRVLGRISPRGWCRLFSQEVYARIADVTAGTGGGGPAPTLALDFMTPGTLSPLITFTRASTGTYFDSAGVMQTAAINAPRWDYDPVTRQLLGLLLEDQRTNTLYPSGDLGAVGWTTAGTGASVAPTVTANNTSAPDGTLTAARIVMPAVAAGANASFVSVNSRAASSVQATFSMWLRGAVGGEIVNLFATSFAAYAHTTVTLTTAWQRVLVTATPTSGGWALGVGTDRRDATQTATAAQTFYAWGAQAEAGGFATSYIPTTAAAVTRSIDSCTVQPASMGWFTAPGGSWFAEFIMFNPAPSISTRVIGRIGATSATPLFLNSSRMIGQSDSASMVTANAITANVVNKAASTWATGRATACSNGGAVASSAALVTGYGVLTGSGIYLLMNATVPADSMMGYMRAVWYWPAALSDAQLQAMTT